MPKASPIQPSFSGGEFSPRVYGRVDSERYKTGLATCLNYLPTTQGPLVRRPGFKYVGNDVKDPSKPPTFLEFKFNQTQNYVIEVGDLYMRFYTNNGQILTSSTSFKVSGRYGTANASFRSSNFYASRTSPISNAGETILASSIITSGSILEIQSPYSYPDFLNVKVAQKEDTLYLVHSSYPEYKLQRFGSTLWDLKRVNHQDGPYLPFNSYVSPGDSIRVGIQANAPQIIYQDSSSDYRATTFPRKIVNNINTNGAGLIRVTSTAHGFVSGDSVVIKGVTGSVEANNGTSSIAAMSWKVIKVDDDNFDLAGSFYGFSYTGSGVISPALFQPYQTNLAFSDIGRVVGLIRGDGGRAWGRIFQVEDPSTFWFHVDANTSPLVTGSSADLIVDAWQLGAWSQLNGYPSTVCFHQDRQFLAGTPQYPQRFDASKSSEYENFQSSGSSLVVSDNSALSFSLNSDQLNKIQWLKSDAQGLLCGTFASEWNITANNQAAALTPTNVNAAQTSFFGSANSDAVQTGNATLYVQRAQRKIRELNYFFQVNTYRSTDITELSEHVTNPAVVKMSVQKEPIPIVWLLRSDGQLVSMVYNRDDATLKVGLAPHTLGGQSDSGGSPPIVKTMAVIPSPDGSFDQLWIATQRFINGTSVVNVEYSTQIFEDKTKQEDAFYVDCGGTYNSPITITGITRAGSAIVSAASHGFANGDSVKIDAVVGLNSSYVDLNGIIFNSNLVNAHTFMVGSTSTNAFFLQDFNGNYVSSISYSPYISGGEARKLISTISGLTWLKNETVAVLADGGVHPISTINSAGVLALQFPAAKVQIGYPYNSDGKTLRTDAGSATGTAIGKIRRNIRVAFMLHKIGELSIGTSFDRLTPLEFTLSDQQSADVAAALFSGIVREGLESEYDFDGYICFRQNAPLPGMVQTITPILEENDV